jgi:prolipoprotein diacylglyceryltransferase
MQYFFGRQGNIINSETWAKVRVDIKYKGNDHPRIGHENPEKSRGIDSSPL